MLPEMGKYGMTVAAAYGVSLLLLAGIVVQSLWAARRARRALEEQQRRG